MAAVDRYVMKLESESSVFGVLRIFITYALQQFFDVENIANRDILKSTNEKESLNQRGLALAIICMTQSGIDQRLCRNVPFPAFSCKSKRY